jgi:hypothetical protein
VRKISLLSTAAIVLLGAGVASAQQVKDDGGGRVPAAQQNAPVEKSAPSMRAGERRGLETTGQSSHETSPGASSGRASQDLKPGADKGSGSKSPETSGQSPKADDQDKPGSGIKNSSDTDNARKSGSSATMKNQSDSDTRSKNNAQGSSTSRSSESATDRTTNERTTTGQGAASGSVKLSTEQRTKISSVIKQQKVEPTRLNVSVRVGTRIPDSVRFHPLPLEVVNVYPEWRGYNYILVGEQIVVIDPRTHEIVAILDA